MDSEAYCSVRQIPELQNNTNILYRTMSDPGYTNAALSVRARALLWNGSIQGRGNTHTHTQVRGTRFHSLHWARSHARSRSSQASLGELIIWFSEGSCWVVVVEGSRQHKLGGGQSHMTVVGNKLRAPSASLWHDRHPCPRRESRPFTRAPGKAGRGAPGNTGSA